MENQERLYSVDPWHWSRSKKVCTFYFLGRFSVSRHRYQHSTFRFGSPKRVCVQPDQKRLSFTHQPLRVLDMPLHLIFGVEVNGAQELRPRKLGILYLRPLGWKSRNPLKPWEFTGMLSETGWDVINPMIEVYIKIVRTSPQKRWDEFMQNIGSLDPGTCMLP